ncbi:MAG: hypothetical protein BWX99_02842 [Deltaproteobacteria bacterium ADurb.Bin151]|nr:MAG: hypothetical protein BWX99_02842 [Deltaproteobacteria bacterium ADurb.Bin151]
MNQGDNGAQAIAEFKAPRNVNEHADPGKDNCQNGLVGQILADFGTYEFYPPDFKITGSELPVHGFFHFCLKFFGHGLVGSHDDFILTDFLNDGVVDFNVLEGLANDIRPGGFGEFYLNNGSSGKIDPEIQAFVHDDGQDADDDQYN